MPVIEAIAVDNLVTRNGTRTPASELFNFVFYLTQGVEASKDHQHSVDCEWGTVVGAQLLKLEGAYPFPLSPENQAIVDSEGYYFVLVQIEAAGDPPGLGDGVSLGFMVEKITCPNCDCGGDLYSGTCSLRGFPKYLEYIGISDVLEISRVLAPAVRNARILNNGGKERQIQSD